MPVNQSLARRAQERRLETIADLERQIRIARRLADLYPGMAAHANALERQLAAFTSK